MRSRWDSGIFVSSYTLVPWQEHSEFHGEEHSIAEWMRQSRRWRRLRGVLQDVFRRYEHLQTHSPVPQLRSRTVFTRGDATCAMHTSMVWGCVLKLLVLTALAVPAQNCTDDAERASAEPAQGFQVREEPRGS